MPSLSHRFVWYNSHGQGRNRFALFRRSFELKSAPREAKIHLFADTAYQLFVNGEFAQFGPLRFDVRRPRYDTIDLADHLRPGRNVVAVLVKSFGCKTFKDNSEQAGFIAWGKMKDGSGGTVDFGTASASEWRTKRCRAFDEHAVKMSFALDPIDIYRQENEDTGWTTADFDDSAWGACVELEKPEIWGELQPRTIPFMELDEAPRQIHWPVDPLSDEETVYSFSVPGPDFHGPTELFSGRDKMAIGVATWIHSPRDQEVTLGLFWGHYFFNGKECADRQGTQGLRTNGHVALRKGWNAFFARERFSDDCLSFMIGAPKGAGLSLSPRKRLDDDCHFLRTKALEPCHIDRALEKGVPEAGDESFAEAGGWVEVSSGEMEGNPARRGMWDLYGQPFEQVTADGLVGKSFPLASYPHGFSVMIDLEEMRLVLPQLSLSGGRGSIVELAYSEHLMEDRRHLLHNVVYAAGDRAHVSQDRMQFMPSQPRGARYIRLTVRQPKDDVTIDQLRFLSCRYPVQRLGAFRCSDPVLNDIWEMCRRTQHANMEDVYVDCSGRERGMYLRDTIIQFHNALAAFGDTALMGRCMELFGQSPDASGKFRCVYPNKGSYTIADFAIEAIDGYWRYYLNTGDRERLQQDWPAMLGSIGWFNQLSDEREDGLLDADWPERRKEKQSYGGLHGDNKVPASLLDKTGPNANLTFPYLLMLRSATRIARLLGDDGRAEDFDRRRERVMKNARRLFWNDEAEGFNDNLAGKTQSFHASLLAVNAGVATPEQEKAIRRRLLREFDGVFVNGYSPDGGCRFSPAYSFFIFQGLYALNLAGLAERLMRQGWGWMLAQGARTTPEFFQFTASHCHAWSACPMYYLSRYALGINFTLAPDFSIAWIDIRSDLDWAEGSFPIPGTGEKVDIKWQRRSEGRIAARVNAPDCLSLHYDSNRIELLHTDLEPSHFARG